MEGFLRYEFGGLIFGEAYTRRGLFSEFYGIRERLLRLSILLSISSSSQGGVFIPLGLTCQLISALSYVSFLMRLIEIIKILILLFILLHL